MIRRRSRKVISMAVLLGLSLMTMSCASMTASDGPMPMHMFYDLPNTLDANDVIHAVERSFTQVLLTSPRIVEGEVPSPLPDRPSRFTLTSRIVHLDHLGTVRLPTVNCPHNLAVISAWSAKPGSIERLDRYTACIQPYTEGYRVTILVNTPGVQDPLRNQPKGWDDFGPISHIAQALFEEIRLTRVPAVPIPSTIAYATRRVASLEKLEKDDMALLRERPSPTRRPQRAAALPLVCLAPKDHAAILQSRPGGGKVVGTVELGSVLAVAEPLDTSFFKVESEGGPSGWVNRSDVKRLPCPVG